MYLKQKTTILYFLFLSIVAIVYIKLIVNEFDNFLYINISFYNTFLVYFGFFIIFLWVKFIFKINPKIFLFIFIGFFSCFTLEFILRYVVKYPLSYSESNGGIYRSTQKNLPTNMNYLLSEGNRDNVHTIEYKAHSWRNVADAEDKLMPHERYNRFGMRGRVPTRSQDFIVALGDSFTESVCVSYEHSYPRVLEKKLQQSGLNVGVLNAGVSSNDPFFDWKMLQKINKKFNVKAAVFLINHTDVNDIVIRGGHERFLQNGLIEYNKAPSWERIYALSFVFRAIMKIGFRYNYNLHSPNQAIQKNEEALIKLYNLFQNEIIPFCEHHDIDLFVAVHPLKWNLEKFLNPYIELKEVFTSIDNLKLIDTYQALLTESRINKNLFYPLDLHFNEKGYEIVAHEISEIIIEFYNPK